MQDAEKQEGQKTVVAFVAGLLIGGLLVWVFSSSPADTPADTGATNGGEQAETADSDGDTENENADAADDASEDEDASDESDSDTSSASDESETIDESSSDENESDATVSEDASVSVPDQAAGPVVVIDEVTFPTNDGWIAVRDFDDGVSGRILGAARYSVDVGLVPSDVNLLRATEAGNTYQVVFYTENGDRAFDLADDTLIEGVSDTFSAQ